jgi:acyl dehydratase
MNDQHRAEWFDDYAVGDTVTSPVMTITADDVRAYSRFTNDVRAIFKPAAADGGVAVPQMYLFSLGVALLLHGAGTYIPRHFVAFFGFELIEFHRDVLSGTIISSTATVTDLTPRGPNGLITYLHRTSSGDGRLLVSSSHRILVRQRGADD